MNTHDAFRPASPHWGQLVSPVALVLYPLWLQFPMWRIGR